MTAKKKSSKKPVKVALLSPKELDEMVAEFEFKFKRAIVRKGKSILDPRVEMLIIRTSKALREVLGT